MNATLKFLSVSVFCMWLGTLPIAAQQLSSAASATQPAMPTSQQRVINELAAFYRRVKQDAPGYPKGTNLGTVIQDWSKEQRTIRVKTGERYVPRTYPAGVQVIEDFEDRQVTRIYFGPFTGPDEGGTAAEYDPQFGVIKLRDGLATSYAPPTTPRPRYGDENIRDLFERIEHAQTLWHECLHTTQGRQPGSMANETITWHATLATTREWIKQLQDAYNAERSLENVRYLIATIDAWQNYYAAVQNKTSLKEINSRPLPTSELATLEALEEELRQQHQAIEILEGLTGPSAVPGMPRTLDSMLEQVQATSLTDLEAQLFKSARMQIDQGKWRHLAAAKKDTRAREQVSQAIGVVRPAWQRRAAAAAQVAGRLVAFKLQVAADKDTVQIDPAAGKATLDLRVENNDEFGQLVQDLVAALKRLAGSSAVVSVTEQWDVTDQAPSPITWQGEADKSLDFTKAKRHKISASRSVSCNVNLTSQNVPSPIVCGSNSLEVRVLAPFPTELAGHWRGSFVIRTTPLIDQLLAEAKTADSTGRSSGETDPLGEGCSIPPEAFARLSALKGTAMDVDTLITPRTFMSGQMTVTVTPAAQSGMGQGKPVTLEYTYRDGQLTANGGDGSATIIMSATFKPADQGWSLSGWWRVNVAEKGGRPVVAMTGTWTGANPDAE